MRRQAFTAIELAVVLALILILAVILMPALEKGREKAVETKCLARVRQVGLACALYQGSYNGQWPWAHRSVRPDHPEWPDPTGSLAALYPSFAPQAYLFQCPTTNDVVVIDPVARDFANCTNWYVAPNGRATRPEDAGKGAPCPPSYFYDAGSNGRPGIPSDAPSFRVVYGDNSIHGVWKGQKREEWLGKDNHPGEGNFLFADKHVARLTQVWQGVPRRLGRGVPSVPNPYAEIRGPGGRQAADQGDPNVFQEDFKGAYRDADAYLSGMMWVEGSWMEF